MTHIERAFYWGGMFLWIASECLFPTWVGRLYYSETVQGQVTWREAGVFGLRGPDSYSQRTLLGTPPQAHDSEKNPSIRWPWQPPREAEHFELELSIMFARSSIALLVLGYLVGILHLFAVQKKPELLISAAWSVSISLSITWLVVWPLAVLSQGYLASGSPLIAILAVGILAGVVGGVGSWLLRSRKNVA